MPTHGQPLGSCPFEGFELRSDLALSPSKKLPKQREVALSPCKLLPKSRSLRLGLGPPLGRLPRPLSSAASSSYSSSSKCAEMADYDDDGGFAQTRGDDSLFDDEIVPVETTTPEPAPQGDHQPQPPQASYSRGAPTPRRGGSRGERGGRQMEASIHAPTQPTVGATDEQATPPQNAPQGPKAQAVRGDRTGTGGVVKPKLTSEELEDKMAKMKLASQERSKAHAAAEADKASADKREKIAQEKRRAEKQNHRVMENDREQNRQRKIKAMGGREWDAEKETQSSSSSSRPHLSQKAYDEARNNLEARDFEKWLEENEAFTFHDGMRVEVRRRDYWRGHPALRESIFYDKRKQMLTGQSSDLSLITQSFENSEQADQPRGRGQRGGGRGRGSGRGRGRGKDQSNDLRAQYQEPFERPQAPQKKEDFPALPGGSLAQSRFAIEQPQTKPKQNETSKVSEALSPTAAEGTWAEQVESNEAAKTKA